MFDSKYSSGFNILIKVLECLSISNPNTIIITNQIMTCGTTRASY